MMDDEIIPYDIEWVPTLHEWFDGWGIPKPQSWAFSDLGFIVPGVAAGFLYTSNSGLAHIDFYISNPDSDKAHRSLALDAITRRIIEEAKALGVRMLACSTKHQAVVDRAEAFGFFKTGGHMCLSKEL